MSVSVVFSSRAADQILEIEIWWRTNRPALAERFTVELDGSLDLLERYPLAGQVHRNRQVKGARKLLMTETSHYLYYTYDSGAAQIEVIAVWSTHHRRGPKLTP
jgi:plasmid stabilization system protein ParE